MYKQLTGIIQAIVLGLAIVIVVSNPAIAAADCNQPAAQPITFVNIPGHPFEALPTGDGCWIFVSAPPGIAVLRRTAGAISLVRFVSVPGGPATMVFSPDNKTLLVANGSGVLFVDVARLKSGQGNPVIGHVDDATGVPPDTASYMGPQRTSQTTDAGTVFVNITPDGQFLFAADEWTQAITVIDLRQGYDHAEPMGRMVLGVLPSGFTSSRDHRYLFTTSQIGLKSYGWKVECKDQLAPPEKTDLVYPQGAILVIDVAKAVADPSNAVISKAPAGCSPVRLVISPDGRTAYATARNSNALLAFDTLKLVADPEHARIGEVPVGTAPVGIDVVNRGRWIVVTNSNRFGGNANDKQSLTVIDASKVGLGAAAVVGTIQAGSFPREIRLTADQRTMLVTNFGSQNIEIVDVRRMLK